MRRRAILRWYRSEVTTVPYTVPFTVPFTALSFPNTFAHFYKIQNTSIIIIDLIVQHYECPISNDKNLKSSESFDTD